MISDLLFVYIIYAASCILLNGVFSGVEIMELLHYKKEADECVEKYKETGHDQYLIDIPNYNGYNKSNKKFVFDHYKYRVQKRYSTRNLFGIIITLLIDIFILPWHVGCWIVLLGYLLLEFSTFIYNLGYKIKTED